jgi:hypothetical protein
MDLKSLERRERIKAYSSVVIIVFIVVAFMIMWTMEEQEPVDEVTECVRVISDKDSYTNDDVEYCRRLLNDIIRRKKTITT